MGRRRMRPRPTATAARLRRTHPGRLADNRPCPSPAPADLDGSAGADDSAFAASHVVSPVLGRLTLNILDWLATVR